MLFSRRSILGVVTAGFAMPALADDATRAERAIGNPEAKVTAMEFFSLTCSHCAAFARNTMPRIKSDLIDKGLVRFVFRDFPLDQLALTAALVARHLPVARYEPFIMTLLSTQDRWAFNRSVNSIEELAKMAGLAGMSRAGFDAALADTALRDWILARQDEDSKQWKIGSTPSFVINGETYSGEMSFEAFRKLIPG